MSSNGSLPPINYMSPAKRSGGAGGPAGSGTRPPGSSADADRFDRILRTASQSGRTDSFPSSVAARRIEPSKLERPDVERGGRGADGPERTTDRPRSTGPSAQASRPDRSDPSDRSDRTTGPERGSDNKETVASGSRTVEGDEGSPASDRPAEDSQNDGAQPGANEHVGEAGDDGGQAEPSQQNTDAVAPSAVTGEDDPDRSAQPTDLQTTAAPTGDGPGSTESPDAAPQPDGFDDLVPPTGVASATDVQPPADQPTEASSSDQIRTSAEAADRDETIEQVSAPSDESTMQDIGDNDENRGDADDPMAESDSADDQTDTEPAGMATSDGTSRSGAESMAGAVTVATQPSLTGDPPAEATDSDDIEAGDPLTPVPGPGRPPAGGGAPEAALRGAPPTGAAESPPDLQVIRSEATAADGETPAAQTDVGDPSGPGGERPAQATATGAGGPSPLGAATQIAPAQTIGQLTANEVTEAGIDASALAPADETDAADPLWRQVRRAIGSLRTTTTGEQQLTIRLRPAELGSVVVRINTGDNGTTVSLVAESSAAANQLNQQRQQLLSDLEDSGLGAVNVDIDSSGTDAGAQTEESDNDTGNGGRDDRTSRASADGADVDLVRGYAARRNRSTSSGLVDVDL